MPGPKILTEVGIRSMISATRKTGREQWVSDGLIPRTHGGLQLRVKPAACFWYFRYTDAQGKKQRIPLGILAFEKTPAALTLAEARAEAARLAALYQSPQSRDVRDHLKQELKREAAERTAAEQARLEALAALAEANKNTLQRLLTVYVALLRHQGKSSAAATETCLSRHVIKARPDLAGKPANEVTARDIASLLRPLVEEGKGRTAGKLRSYLHAAFVWAARAELDPDAPADFLPFRVEQNPVSGTATLSKYNRARERALSEPELREYYSAIKALPDSAIRDATLLMILLGGQRIAQLIRARTIDVDDNAGTLRLLDPKGRRTQPRSHVLPLSRPAMAVVERCLVRVEAQQKQARMKGGAPLMGFLFSTHGDVPIRPESVSKATFEIVRKLLSKPEEERVIHELFRLGDIRRTCETRLAALGMSVDLRGQIQSHGLSGVQARHYDKHDYLKEKLAALTSWADWLEQRLASKVLPIRKGERNE